MTTTMDLLGIVLVLLVVSQVQSSKTNNIHPESVGVKDTTDVTNARHRGCKDGVDNTLCRTSGGKISMI